tara:strand:+ start:1086 stop:1364 length:279 start_codon:yes stop_codon:yes gene_type:complete
MEIMVHVPAEKPKSTHFSLLAWRLWCDGYTLLLPTNVFKEAKKETKLVASSGQNMRSRNTQNICEEDYFKELVFDVCARKKSSSFMLRKSYE